FDFDPASLTLRRAGSVEKAGQRALRLLAALVGARGSTVSKPALMDSAWPNLFVEEANLTVQISQLRRLLGPRDDGGEWIVTVPGLGYRFAAEQPVERQTGWPGLVVLPFAYREGDADMGYFAEGIVSDLITALASFQSLVVVSRNVAFSYRDRDVDSRDA